ncbi:hypothetical protein NLG97_g4249 [Lecanicillium saksenae]|uniref:Uncharacterized protein n=1 Tax=Lecanicillium saksenae TaxID=468837 RepID=A0ACC1QWD6_9HYPO|nr:hypothetical protein NLG97_g4249 [Lecanicillium saksenae]
MVRRQDIHKGQAVEEHIWYVDALSDREKKAATWTLLAKDGVEFMTVKSAKLEQTTEKWELMSRDREDREMPTVQVVPGEEEGIQGLTIRVHDAEAAERKFKELLPHFPDSLQWQFI